MQANDKLNAEIEAWDKKYCHPEQLEAVQSMWEVPSTGVFVYLNQDNLKMDSSTGGFTLTGLELGLIQPRFR
eukprot:SAG31_NODE_1156_length_9616_cov_26.963014_10_plen_72_part_00